MLEGLCKAGQQMRTSGGRGGRRGRAVVVGEGLAGATLVVIGVGLPGAAVVVVGEALAQLAACRDIDMRSAPISKVS